MHIPVLFDEIFKTLTFSKGQFWVDCTFGRGGHSREILKRIGPNGLLLALDQDLEAINFGRKTFEVELRGNNLNLVHANFQNLDIILKAYKAKGLHPDGIFADFGLSSNQLDSDQRGFSFRWKDAPLDMRMDEASSTPLARDILNSYPADQLSEIFKKYGDEPKHRYLAKLIVERRNDEPIKSVGDFQTLIDRLWRKSKRNPAARIFQALRIEVNQELKAIDELVETAFHSIESNGQLGFISFHSLEDRIVKKQFLKWCQGTSNEMKMISKEKLPVTEEIMRQLSSVKAKKLKPFPVKATAVEIERNSRARSAVLRCITKL